MLVLRTICNTDWKGRPSHTVSLIAKVGMWKDEAKNREDAIEAMDKDVAKWMAVDIAADEWCEKENEGIEPEAGSDTARAAELVATETPEKLLEMWRHQDRFEMRLEDADHREFVERCEGDCTTIVYHFLTDENEGLEYTERR